MADKHNNDRCGQHAGKAGDFKPGIHGCNGNNRMQPDLAADNTRFQNIAQHFNDAKQQKQADPSGHIAACDQCGSPGDENGSCADKRQNIKHGDHSGDWQHIVEAEQSKTKRQLDECYGKQNDIGPYKLPDCFAKKTLCFTHARLPALGNQRTDRRADSAVVCGCQNGNDN